MRNGREPRRLRAVEALDSHVMAEPQPRSPQPGEERPNLVAVPAQGLSDGQMSFNAVEEEDEVLFRISVDALTGEDDLVSEGDADEGDADDVETEAVAEPEVEPEAAEVAAEPAEPAESVVAAEPKTVTEMAADLVAAAIADGLRADAAPVAEVAEAEFEAEAPSTSLIADLAAHPLPYEPPQTPQVEDPSLQARLARIHLRTGSLSIARRELETLAGRNQLDTAGRLDLAEARWRTGDLHGAGEAASAYLAANGEEVLGFVIAAEASAMANRIAEARHYVEQAMQRYLSDLDPVFAGIARKAMWAEVVPAPVPAPVIETTPDPVQAAPAPLAVEPAVEPEAVVEPAVDPEAVVEPAVEPEAVVEPAAEPEAVVEPAAEPEAVVEPAAEPEAVVEPAATPELVVEPEPAVEPEAVVEPAVEPEAVVELAVEHVVEPAPELAVEPAVEQGATPELVVEPEPAVEPEAVVESAVGHVVEPESEHAVEPEPAPLPEPEAVIEPVPAAEAVVEPEPEPEAVVEPEPEPELVVEPEPEPRLVVEPESEQAGEPVVEVETPEDPTVAPAEAEIASGRAYLEGNDPLLAALHFGVALRLNQSRAGAVIEAIGDRQDLPLQMVRAEAIRLVGVSVELAPAVQSVVAEPAPEPVAEPEPEPLAPPRAPEPPPIRWD